MPGPVANDTRQSQDGTVKKGLHRPSLSAIILSSRPLALILIAAPFSSRLSRYSKVCLSPLSKKESSWSFILKSPRGSDFLPVVMRAHRRDVVQLAIAAQAMRMNVIILHYVVVGDCVTVRIAMTGTSLSLLK